MSAVPAEQSQPAEPTARIVRPAEGCFTVVEVDVPAPVPEVWESVATGPGHRRWFVESELEERVGGRLVSHHGDFGDSVGTITVWEPPHRYAYVESDWRGEGTAVPDWTTEITVHRLYPTEPESGPGPGLGRPSSPVHDDGAVRTRVRLTSGVATGAEQWGDDIEGTLPGWTSALRLLAEFHAHFAGRETAHALVMRQVPVGHRLVPALGLAGAVVGHQATASGEAGGQAVEVTGTVLDVTGGAAGEGPDGQDAVTLRVDDGDAAASGTAPGVYEFGTMQFGETRMSVVRGYLHLPTGAEPGAEEAARTVERQWAAVLDGLLGSAREPN